MAGGDPSVADAGNLPLNKKESTLMNNFLPNVATRALAFGLALAALTSTALPAADTGRTFATPEDAVMALAGAVKTTNHTDLRAIFGPAWEDLVNPDTVQAANEFAAFAAEEEADLEDARADHHGAGRSRIANARSTYDSASACCPSSASVTPTLFRLYAVA